jgi:DNA polymerase-3 subunit alpha
VKFDFLAQDPVGAAKGGADAREAGATVDLDCSLGRRGRSTSSSSAATRWACSSSNRKACGATLAAVKPTSFEDIIALVSLYRPGPMDNIPTFGARKNGREEIAYPHPLLENVLKETYGIFVYQEQVMEAARVLAGYSLGEADLLRARDGQEDPGGDGRAARALRYRLRGQRIAGPRPTSCST